MFRPDLSPLRDVLAVYAYCGLCACIGFAVIVLMVRQRGGDPYDA